ncbi:hypothetical protein BC835DRAFT_563433 [Cytidiella melzeri]|nr:hypothetical protein BC835DRAFT_563433 [Cytidiella melzeri]
MAAATTMTVGMAGVATPTTGTRTCSSYGQFGGVGGRGELRGGVGKAGSGDAKMAEWARLGDFFSKLTSGDYKSLYEEVSKTPKKTGGGVVAKDLDAEQRACSPSPCPSTNPIGPVALVRIVSTGSTSTTTSIASVETKSTVPSPPSSISSLPSKASASCMDCSSDDDEDEEPTRGRTRTRSTASRFRRPPQPITYTAEFPEGSYSSYKPFPARFEEEDKATMGGKFTFKMMLHELYEDVDGFRRMIEKVLEESKAQFRPLAKKATRGSKYAEEVKGWKGEGEMRSWTVSDVEGAGQMEDVRKSVAERAAKKRKVRLGSALAVPREPAHESDKDELYVLKNQLDPAFTEGGVGSERRVSSGAVAEQIAEAACRILDEKGPYAVVVQPRTKRLLSR